MLIEHTKKWKVVLGGELELADDAIYTIDDELVLGSSQWLIGKILTLCHIVNLHNLSLDCKSPDNNSNATEKEKYSQS